MRTRGLSETLLRLEEANLRNKTGVIAITIDDAHVMVQVTARRAVRLIRSLQEEGLRLRLKRLRHADYPRPSKLLQALVPESEEGSLGEYIRDARIQAGHTQQQLANLLRTSQQVVSQIEQDKRVVGLDMARRLEAHLDLPLMSILDLTEAGRSESVGKWGVGKKKRGV